MTNSRTASAKQLDAIERAARRAGFGDVQDAVNAADVRSTNWRYDLRMVDASMVLDALAAGLKPLAPPTDDQIATDEGGIPAADAISLLGKSVQLTGRSGKLFTGKVCDIKPMDDGGAAFTLRTQEGRYLNIRLINAVGWAIIS